MKLSALVVGDEIIDRPASRDFPASRTRQLLCVDQDDTPLQAMVTVVVPVDDPVAPASNGADLRGHRVELAIREWAQYDGNKKHVAKGHLVRLEGIMRFDAIKPAAASKAA